MLRPRVALRCRLYEVSGSWPAPLEVKRTVEICAEAVRSLGKVKVTPAEVLVLASDDTAGLFSRLLRYWLAEP